MNQLVQIQAVRLSNPEAKEVFIYHNASGRTYYLPFRVGDIVRVTDWEESYSNYTNAFIYFTNSSDKPYYCCNDFHIRERRREDGEKQLFKIVKVAEHEFSSGGIVCYIQDRAKRGIVIGPEGLKLVKQFPLRKNETINIVLEKIK